MYTTLRPLLFALSPEVSHELALAALRVWGALPGPVVPAGPAAAGTSRAVQCLGLRFANPVGLAAGLDKNAVAVEGLARLGFGSIEIGTVTPRGQPGNPRPRLFRLTAAEALINRMGFNNDGAAVVAARLARLRERDRLGGTVLGVNVGKNRDTPLDAAAGDYRRCMEAVYEHADYLTLNLSSPNTPGLRTLQSGAALAPLLTEVRDSQERLAGRHGRRVPLLVKIAPDLADEDLSIIAEAVRDFAIDGVIATNTTIARPGVAHLPTAAEAGGLSGAPLAPLSRDLVGRLRARLDPAIPIIGVGGIMDAAGGRALLQAGADLLQIYTGLIYRGPGLIRQLAQLPPARAGYG